MSGPKGQTVEQKVFEILKEQFGEDEVINSETNIVEELGADSLDVLELIEYCEREFDMIIPSKDVQSLLCPRDITSYVEKSIQDKNAANAYGS